VKAAHAVGVPVVVGGRAFGTSGVRAGQIGADAWVPSPRDLPNTIEGLTPDIDGAEAQASDPTEALTALMAQRSSILAEVESRLSPSGWSEPMKSGLSLLVGAVEGALLLSDRALVQEHLVWQSEAFESHGQGDLDALRTTLADVLAPWPDAAAILG
jgi:hypothetical protein